MNKAIKLLTIALTAYIFFTFSGFSTLVLAESSQSSSSSKSSSSSSKSSSKVSSKSSSRTSLSRSSKTSSEIEDEDEDEDENELKPVRFEVGNVEDTLKESNSALSEYKAAKAAEKLVKLKALGVKVINERISFLQNRLTTKVQNEKNLSDARKAELVLLINNTITDLQAEIAKVEAATDLDTLKGLVKGIYEDYRIYAVFAPKFYAIYSAYKLEFLVQKLDTTLAKVEIRLEENKDTLANYDQLKTLLDSAQTSLDNVQTQIDTAVNYAKEATAAKDTAPAKQSIEKARTALNQAKSSLGKIREDLKKMFELLKTTASSKKSSSKSTSSISTSSEATD